MRGFSAFTVGVIREVGEESATTVADVGSNECEDTETRPESVNAVACRDDFERARSLKLARENDQGLPTLITMDSDKRPP